jgi:hypothetical protein
MNANYKPVNVTARTYILDLAEFRMPHEKGQADVEVTPEMIRAGVIVLEGYSESYHHEMLARAVYTAMRLATCPPPSRSPHQPNHGPSEREDGH